MTFGEMMMEGVGLMLVGMGIVFAFLIVLVFAMKGMSRLAIALGGPPPSATPQVPVAVTPREAEQDELAAVIAAAIARYRKASS